ncbi:hypothetical protein [Micromonospora sp. WMMA1996]|uniref:hypothetical protein n=1 Tax=Micromonospora sp. WMMA1996 TaxID=2039878 RepID=UPI001145B220|nr:hypothetical protein [Micromonospora sp. WMMA1996]
MTVEAWGRYAVTMSDEELRVKHLADIQVTISRLAQNSFTIRSWSVTLVSLVFALLNNKSTASALAWLPLLPAMVFWWLDAYYLRLERLYRRHYAQVATRIANGPPAHGPDVAPFDMDVTRHCTAVPNLLRTMLAPSVVTIPVILTVVITAYRLTTAH